MSRTFEISPHKSWIGPILHAARNALPGDTIVVHNHAQSDFLRMELAQIGKRGVKTVNTRQPRTTARPYDVRDPAENAIALCNWIEQQAHAARQRI
jgi:hypothetical protein